MFKTPVFYCLFENLLNVFDSEDLKLELHLFRRYYDIQIMYKCEQFKIKIVKLEYSTDDTSVANVVARDKRERFVALRAIVPLQRSARYRGNYGLDPAT